MTVDTVELARDIVNDCSMNDVYEWFACYHSNFHFILHACVIIRTFTSTHPITSHNIT